MSDNSKTNSNEENKYRIRFELMLTAIDKIGAISAIDAAGIYAEGIKTRNGAMQYEVMSKQLKHKYYQKWEETNPNWVTGVSSPYVSDYKIVNVRVINANKESVIIKFNTATSTGFYKSYYVTLLIVNDNGYWRITEIVADYGFD